MTTVELPAWLVLVLVLSAGMRGVLRDLIEHNGLSGILRGSTGDEGSGSQDDEK